MAWMNMSVYVVETPGDWKKFGEAVSEALLPLGITAHTVGVVPVTEVHLVPEFTDEEADDFQRQKLDLAQSLI